MLGHDRVLAQINAITGNSYYYLYNGHVDVVQITNTTGSIVNSYDYDVWGNFLEKEETIENPFTYFGQTYDEVTGLYYLRARYYDPTTGRFTQQDPAEDGYNWYVYCGSNPVMFVDPSGCWAEGDENLPYIVNYIINGSDGYTGGLTAQWYVAKTKKEKDRINKVANMLRCETTDFDITKSSSAFLLLDENGAYKQGHMAVLIKNSDGQSVYFSYAGEDGTFIDDGMMSFDVLSKDETDSFFNTGILNYLCNSSGSIMSSKYTKYAQITISSYSGSSMIGKGISYFWNPGTYSVIGNQCDNIASSILSAGGHGYSVSWRPRASFNNATTNCGISERRFGQ